MAQDYQMSETEAAKKQQLDALKIAKRQELNQLSLDGIKKAINEANEILRDPRNSGREEAEITKELGRSIQFRRRRKAISELRDMSPEERRDRLIQAERLGFVEEADLLRSAGQGNNVSINEEASNRRGYKNNLGRLQNEYTDQELRALLNEAKSSGNDRAATLIARLITEREQNPQVRVEAETRLRNAERGLDNLNDQLTPRTKRELEKETSISALAAARVRANDTRHADQSFFQTLDPLSDDDKSLIDDLERELRRIDNPESEKVFGTPARPDLSSKKGKQQFETLLLEQDSRIGKAKLDAYNQGTASDRDFALIEQRKKQIATRIEKTIEQGILDPVGEDLKNRDFGMFDGSNQRPYRGAPAVDSEGIQQELVGTLGRPVKVEGEWTAPDGRTFPVGRVKEWQRKPAAFNNQPNITIFESVTEVPDLNLEQQRLTLVPEEFNNILASRNIAGQASTVNKPVNQRSGTITFERYDTPREITNPITGESILAAGVKRTATGEYIPFSSIQEFETELASTNAKSGESGLVKTFESMPARGELDPVFRKTRNPRERIQRLNPRARVRDFEIEGELGANLDPRTALLQGLQEGKFSLDTPLNEAIQGGVREFREANSISTDLPVARATNLQVQTVGDLLNRLNTDGETRFERKVVNPVREQMLEQVRTVARQRQAEGLKFTKADAELVGQKFMRDLEAQTPWTEKDANGRLSLSQFDEVRMVPVLTSGQAAQVQNARAEAQSVRARADRFAIGELTEDDFQGMVRKARLERGMPDEVRKKQPQGFGPNAEAIGRPKLGPAVEEIGGEVWRRQQTEDKRIARRHNVEGGEVWRRQNPDGFAPLKGTEVNIPGSTQSPLMAPLGDDPNNRVSGLIGPNLPIDWERRNRNAEQFSTEALDDRRGRLVATPSNIDQIRADRAFVDKAREVRRRQEREASVLGEIRGDKKVNTFFNQEVPGQGNIGNYVVGPGATPASDAESLLVNNRSFNSSPFANDFQFNAQDNLNRLEQMLLGEEASRAEWGSNADEYFIGKKGMENMNIKAFKGLNPKQQNGLLTRTEPVTITNAGQAGQANFVGQGPLKSGKARFVKDINEENRGYDILPSPEPRELTPVGEWARSILDTEGRRDGVFNVGLDRVNIEGDEDMEGNLAKALDPKDATPIRAVEIGEELNELNRRLRMKGVNIGRPVTNLSDFEEALDKLKLKNNELTTANGKRRRRVGTPVIDWSTGNKKTTYVLDPTPAQLLDDLEYRGEEANFKVAQALFQQGEARVNTEPRSLITPAGNKIMKDEVAQAAQLQREGVFVGPGLDKNKREVAAELRKLGGDKAIKRIEEDFIKQAQQLIELKTPGRQITNSEKDAAKALAHEFMKDDEIFGKQGMMLDEANKPFVGIEAGVMKERRLRERERKFYNDEIKAGNIAGEQINVWKETNFTGDNSFMLPLHRANVLERRMVNALEKDPNAVSPERFEIELARQEQVNERGALFPEVKWDERNPNPVLANPIIPGGDQRAQQSLEIDDQFNRAGSAINDSLYNEQVGKERWLNVNPGLVQPDLNRATPNVPSVSSEAERSLQRLSPIARRDQNRQDFGQPPVRRTMPSLQSTIQSEAESRRTEPSLPQASGTELLNVQQGIRDMQDRRLDSNTPGLEYLMGRQRGGALVPVNAPRPQSSASTRAPQMINDPWESATSVPHTTAADSISRESSQRKAPKKEFTNIRSSAGNDASRAYSNMRENIDSSQRKERERNILDQLQDVMRSPSRRGTRRNIGIGAAGLGTGALVGAGLSGGRQEEEDERYYR